MQKKALRIKIILFIVCNLTIASSFKVFAQNISSNIAVTPCINNCFQYEFPSDKEMPSTYFLNPNGDYIFINFPYLYNIGEAAGDKIMIRDLRFNPPESFDFQVFANISNLTLNNNPNIAIPYTDIGIISYNDSSYTSTVDNEIGDDDVNSLINPKNPATSQNIEPFTEEIFTTLIKSTENGQTHTDNITAYYSDPSILPNTIDDYFTFFTGTLSSQSDSLQILDAPPLESRSGRYTMGLGMIIKTPQNPDDLLLSGDYSLDITFTILL